MNLKRILAWVLAGLTAIIALAARQSNDPTFGFSLAAALAGLTLLTLRGTREQPKPTVNESSDPGESAPVQPRVRPKPQARPKVKPVPRRLFPTNPRPPRRAHHRR